MKQTIFFVQFSGVGQYRSLWITPQHYILILRSASAGFLRFVKKNHLLPPNFLENLLLPPNHPFLQLPPNFLNSSITSTFSHFFVLFPY